MNKQKAIKRIEDLYLDNKFTLEVKSIISQIDEPKKVVIPKFVAEWIEEKKKSGIDLHKSMAYEVKADVFRYIMDNSETYACAWLDGYEVEQEKLYTVEIPDPNRDYNAIFHLLKADDGKVKINACSFSHEENKDIWKIDDECHLTESEIKQDFEWAWNAGFAKEVE